MIHTNSLKSANYWDAASLDTGAFMLTIYFKTEQVPRYTLDIL